MTGEFTSPDQSGYLTDTIGSEECPYRNNGSIGWYRLEEINLK
jgi:hypothetical protein